LNTKFWSEDLAGRDPLERRKRRWEGNIRKDLGEIWWEDADWIHRTMACPCEQGNEPRVP